VVVGWAKVTLDPSLAILTQSMASTVRFRCSTLSSLQWPAMMVAQATV
jgi:hypothetical protein